MPTLHAEYSMILEGFARLFSKRIWKQAKTLLIGAILCPAERTVTAALRVMGLSGEIHFQNYAQHDVIVFSIVQYGQVWKPAIFCSDY
jgi:hypothetical protein